MLQVNAIIDKSAQLLATRRRCSGQIGQHSTGSMLQHDHNDWGRKWR